VIRFGETAYPLKAGVGEVGNRRGQKTPRILHSQKRCGPIPRDFSVRPRAPDSSRQ
jgi:hypothetical protein